MSASRRDLPDTIPDARQRRYRKLLLRALERSRASDAERRKGLRDAGHAELEDPLCALKTLQALLAEIGELEVGVGDDGPRRRGAENLSAVPRRADPGRAVHVESEIAAVVTDRRLASVQSHPHAHHGVGRPGVNGEGTLGGIRRADRVVSTPEREEEFLAARIDLEPACLVNGRAQQPAMVTGNRRPAVAEPLHQFRRSLDISQQERDGACWQSGGCGCHSASSVRPGPRVVYCRLRGARQVLRCRVVNVSPRQRGGGQGCLCRRADVCALTLDGGGAGGAGGAGVDQAR